MLRPSLVAFATALACGLGYAHAGDQVPEAVTHLRAVLEKLPEPSREAGFVFEGEIVVGGSVEGTFALSAAPAHLPGTEQGPWLWRLEERRARGEGEDAVEVRAQAYLERNLSPLRGELSRTQHGETSTWTWMRKDTRISIRKTGPNARPLPRFVEAQRPTLTTLAAAVLLARHAPAAAPSLAGDSFHPDFEVLLGQDPFVATELRLEGVETWRGRPAFLARGRWRGRELTLALDPERRAPLGLRLARKGESPEELLPRGTGAHGTAGDVFTRPAKSAQAAALRAGFAFSTNDMEVLGDVIHWPTLRERMGDQVPASVTPEQFRSGLLKRLEETAKNPQPPEMMRMVLQGMLGTLKEEQTADGVKVTFPPMFRGLQVLVAEIEGIWYLIELPKSP